MAELLAPAGSLETVRAAIDAGADAVYLGGKLFNARKFAHNLDGQEMQEAVSLAHLFGVKLYVTVNILVADTELKALTDYLKFLDSLSVDGIIVQDLAVAAIASRVVPNLPLHGSTQMSVADLNGVRFLEHLGFTQVVLARELPLSEIRYICAHANAAIEVFIHGASCMSYSGQCLMSSFIGGRSGNRGACAQPCRLPYQLWDGKKAVSQAEQYLLSLKDLNSADCMADLLKAGVTSFKIEGRMKGSGYVRSVVSAYRLLLDQAAYPRNEQQKNRKKAEQMLADSFNRMYQNHFLKDCIGRQTITEHTSGNLVPGKPDDEWEFKKKIIIYGYLDITGDGRLRLTFWDEAGHSAEKVSSYMPKKALHRPTDKAYAAKQLARLGTTPFVLADVSLWDETYMIPASVLNQLRRSCAATLQEQILSGYVRPVSHSHQISCNTRQEQEMAAKVPHMIGAVSVRCDSLDRLKTALLAGADRIIYGGETYDHHFTTAAEWTKAAELVHRAGKSLWCATPRVFWPRQKAAVQTELRLAAEAGIDGIYAGNMGVFPVLQSMGVTLPVYADWPLNIFNCESAAVYQQAGCQGLTLSTELTAAQIRRIAHTMPLPVEILVAGRIEMMLTEYCQAAAFLGKSHYKKQCGGACGGKKLLLEDRHGEYFPLRTDQYCRNHLLNSRDLDLAPYFHKLADTGAALLRIEGRGRSTEWIDAQTSKFRRLCDGTEAMLLSREDQTVTRGHFFHGIL